ncbi:hypothetical protein [Gemmata obscuriglobus]|uniref:Uncharacterized protein n=1 Tax=Gemmata obscuriglobus TaxID=114 RepID=A0A2Z3GUX1_9BACT|nr:hypothetical protein [Gemmata obscuriglobus]AWM35862.1 hypothetical protein C1280_01725 [Gemmata obscuriglobus]
MSDSDSLFGLWVLWYRAGPHERWRVHGTGWSRPAALVLMDRGGDWFLLEEGRDPNRRRRRKRKKGPR